jgi:outer membrane protein assembly factor BamD (BamD/ComL family)
MLPMRFELRGLSWWFCGLLFAIATGCSSFEQPKAKDPFSEREVKEHDAALDFVDKKWKEITGRGPDREAAQKLFADAKSQYVEAVRLRTEDADASWAKFLEAAANFAEAAVRWPDSALEEESLYLSGESYFFADEYPQAEDSYGRLLKQYPRTQFLDQIQARRFSIAQYWLDVDRQNHESFFTVNMTDDSKPWHDTFGNSMHVYDRIRLDDPTGKLADDATLALGNAYFERNKFIKADEYYTDLRKTFPSSDHQFRAHFLGLKAKLESYQGAEYAGATLDEADKLLRQIIRQFPVESQQEKEFLSRAGSEIRFRLAEREWNRGSFHDRKAEYGAARIYFNTIVNNYSDTPFAENARTRLEEIRGEPDVPPQRMKWLVDLFPQRQTVRPLMTTQSTSSGTTKRR